MAGTGSTLFSSGMFWRQLRFGGNWHHIILWRIVLEAARIWWELDPHYFPVDCFGGSSDLVGTGSTLFSVGLFLEAAQIKRELAFFSGHNLIDEGARRKTYLILQQLLEKY